MPKNLVLVGAIAGAFGVKGEIRLRSFTAQPEDIFQYAPFYDEKGQLAFEVKSWREIKDGFAFISPQVATREIAQEKRNTKLYVPRDKLPPADDDEFYHVDLIGLRLETMAGENMGKVKAIITGAQDLLEITGTPNTKKSWFLPFTLANVPIVDISGGRLVCDVPDGLIETEAEKKDNDN